MPYIHYVIHSSKFIKLANRSLGLLNRFKIEIEIHVHAVANICAYFKRQENESQFIRILLPFACGRLQLQTRERWNNTRTFEIYCWPF